jgi:hypothetical protein
MKKMKKLIAILFIVASLISCTNTPNNKSGGATGNVVNDNLFTVAKEINKRCPMTIDESTRMDSATVFNEYMITYHYTVHTVNNKYGNCHE